MEGGVEGDLKIRMDDGAEVNGAIFRPENEETFPAVFYHSIPFRAGTPSR
jgi:hypothetical protein